MNATLKRRLAKLERELRAMKRAFPISILIGVYDRDADIVGAGIGAKKVERRVGESVDDLTNRASAELGMQFLFAIYTDGTDAC